jgi:drug/metabolite transporter (DMT)-like permease
MDPSGQSTARRMNAAQWGLLVVLSVLWGGSFFFVGVILTALPPVSLVLLRVGFAALILVGICAALGYRIPTGRSVWTAFVTMSILNNVIPFTLFGVGQTEIASGLASILNATTPLFGVLVAHAWTKDERLTRQRAAGVALGFLGVIVMVGSAAFGGGSALWAQLACLVAAASYAVSGVYGRRFQTLGVPPLATAAGQISAATLLMIPLAIVIDRPWTLPMPGLPVWAAVIGLASLSTALGYAIYFRLLATAGATNLLLVTFLIPISAILLGTLFLGERLEVRQLVGMALIGLGLAAIDGRLFKTVRAAFAGKPPASPA